MFRSGKPFGWARRRGLWAVLVAGAIGFSAGRAAETRPVVGVGATRAAVVEAYGWPSGQSQSGDREVLTYPQGQVFLSNGVVERMEFSPKGDWPKPKPRPGPPTATKPKPAPVVPAAEPWVTNYGEACRAARARATPILALFTGSDWSPPCQRFQTEVAGHPAFLKAVVEEFVLLRLDFPTHAPQPGEQRVQNATLRERYRVTTYPSLLLLTADGLEIARVDLAKVRPESAYVDRVIAAIAESKPKPVAMMRWAEKSAADGGSDGRATPAGWWSSEKIIGLYGWVLGVVAVVAMAAVWVLLRRKSAAPAPAETHPKVLMPTPADIAAWPTERVCDVAAALFEFEGARVQRRPAESGADLALLDPREPRAQVLVCCQAAAAGLVSPKAVRNLFATAVAERVDQSWYVSPGGFAPEARQFAGEQDIVLIGGEELLLRLKAVPPLALIRLLATKNV